MNPEDIAEIFPGTRVEEPTKRKTDPRMQELTVYWAEGVWKDQYEMVYPWSGRDAKLLQRLLSWADKAFGETAPDRIKEGLVVYLAETSGFYANERHPFSKFAATPQKWVKNPPKTPQEHRPVKDDGEVWPKCVSDAQIVEWIVELGPERVVKLMLGARRFAPTWYVASAGGMYERVKGQLREMVGEDGLKKLVERATSA